MICDNIGRTEGGTVLLVPPLRKEVRGEAQQLAMCVAVALGFLENLYRGGRILHSDCVTGGGRGRTHAIGYWWLKSRGS